MDSSKSLSVGAIKQPDSNNTAQEQALQGEFAVFDSRNPFVVLGGDATKTQTEMKTLRNGLLRRFHPDLGQYKDNVALANRVTVAINCAWEIIKDFYEGERFTGNLAAFANYLSPEEITKEVEEKIKLVINSKFSEGEGQALSAIFSYWKMKYPKNVYEMLQGLLRSQKLRAHWKSQIDSYKQHGNQEKYIKDYAAIGIDLSTL